MIVEPLYLFELINQNMNDSDCLGMYDKSRKLKMTNPGETVVVSSFDQKLPKIFVKGKGGVVGLKESHFDQVKTWNDWDEPMTGLRVRATEALDSVVEALRDAITELYDPDCKMYNVAIMSLNESSTFVRGLFDYMNKTFKEYSNAMFGEVKAWHITTLLATRLLKLVGNRAGELCPKSRQRDRPRLVKLSLWPHFDAWTRPCMFEA